MTGVLIRTYVNTHTHTHTHTHTQGRYPRRDNGRKLGTGKEYKRLWTPTRKGKEEFLPRTFRESMTLLKLDFWLLDSRTMGE
jgi:hypothetical protein